MNNRPIVSVVIIFLNGERFIREAVESVLAQSYDSWELLLVDDGSTDQSTEIALYYAEQYPGRIQYLMHEGHQNRGMSASRNLGIRHAKGEYIALLDADDAWRPNKLERQVAILQSQPRAAMVCGSSQYWFSWTGAADDLDRDYIPSFGVPTDTLYESPELLLLLHPLGEGAAPCPSDLLMRRELVEHVGGFEEDFRGKFQLYEDQAFLTKVYARAAVFVSSECWDRYRIHPDSCVSVVKTTGQYDSVRLFFLDWLNAYLSHQEVKDGRIWAALHRALGPYGRSISEEKIAELDPREVKWSLRVAGGNVAKLVFPPKAPDVIRIVIEKAESKTRYHIQLYQPHLKVESKHGYTVHFQARADSPRSIFLAFVQAHEPWTGLGLYKRIELTSEWQNCQEEFVATEDDTNGRILFDIGESDISFELSGGVLCSLPDGRPIEPAHPSLDSDDAPGDRAVRQDAEQSNAPGEVHFGALRRVTPISRQFGFDRGLPVDRYYIDKFLGRYAGDIRGRVLEVGDNSYTLRFGGERVTASDILHVDEGDPRATIVADLTHADHIPTGLFDCIILTQTLQFIYDVRAAIATLHRILKPGGVILATFPGISQTYDQEWSECWYWSFTPLSARRLFGDVFSTPNVKIEAFGNVFAAISFLHGLAVNELGREELDHYEPGYEVTITARAEK